MGTNEAGRNTHWIGMSQPPKAAILAPSAVCAGCSAVLRSSPVAAANVRTPTGCLASCRTERETVACIFVFDLADDGYFGKIKRFVV